MLSSEAKVIEALFQIQDKSGVRVPFKLNASQLAYDKVRGQKDIISKARQKGFSTFRIGIQLSKCLGHEGTRAVLMSHEAGATQRLLNRAHFMLEHIIGPKPVIGRSSRNEIYFPKTESTYYIGTAGSRAFGRGDTITDLHMSEYAWWEVDGIKHIAGLLQAVPVTGTICIESTGNGQGNDFYYMYQHAKQLGINVFFRSWWEDLEYSKQPPAEGWYPENFEEYFQDLKLKYKLTDPQMYWYWLKLNEFRLDTRMMQQEYPSSVEECFQATGSSIYHDIPYVEDPKLWTSTFFEGYRASALKGHPSSLYTYVVGADPSGGTGNDKAVCTVLCLETLEQVFSFGLNTIDPVEFAYYLIKVGKHFNEAFIVCEANNHGIATHSILKKKYPLQKIYKKEILKKGKIRYGYINNETSKHEMVGASKEIMDLDLTLYCSDTNEALKGFHETSESKMEGPEDHYVIALCLACIGVKKYYRFKKEAPLIVVPKQEVAFTVKFEDIFNKNVHKGYQPFRYMSN